MAENASSDRQQIQTSLQTAANRHPSNATET